MGSKGGTTQQTSSSSGPPPQVLAEYQGLVNRATNVANQPYQPYQGEMVAPLSSQTLGGLGGINQYANAAQPWLQQEGQMTMANAGPVNPEQFQGMGSLQNFMNPYTQSVIQATQGEMNNQNQQQAQFLNSANISSGAFGGDRAGIGQSILANQQQLAEAPTIAGLNQANYTQAMQNWQNQQGVNLGAQQANAQRGLTGAAQMGQIGVTGQQEGLQGAQAQIQGGTIPQTEQQQIDTAAQQMYQQGQAYPFSTTGWLGNIIEGTGSLSGGQSQTTSPGPNSITQGLGLAQAGIGLLGSLMPSDVRLKENVEHIGKTFDGQNIYRYNFKGDPRTQIGLLAQEEAYRHPGSVQRVGMGDMLGLDYHGATEEAAERGHFAGGGEIDYPNVSPHDKNPAHLFAPGPWGEGSDVTLPPGWTDPSDWDVVFPPPSEHVFGGALASAGGRVGLQGGGMPEAPPGGLTQGVMQPGRSPAMSAGALSPDYALLAMGDPGARMGLGSMSLLGGTSMRPHPDLPFAAARPPGAGQAPPSGGGTPIGEGLPSFTRQGFMGGGAPVAAGPNGQFGYYTPGFQPGVDPVNPVAGVSEALFGEESAGSKHPYTGIDADQIAAIGGGQWLPPITGAKMPDFQNLGSSPQFGGAEASLKGLFGSDYTPGSVPPGTAAPAASSSTPATPPSAADGNYGLRPGFIAANPGKTPAQLATMVDAYHNPSGGFTPAQANQLLNLASQGLVRGGGFGGGGGRGGGGVTGNSGGGTGDMARGGRAGFMDGGTPVPPAIAIQRHLQGRSGFQGGGTPSEDGPERVGNIVPLAAANMPWPRQIDPTGQWGPKALPAAHARVAPRDRWLSPAQRLVPRATVPAPAPGGGGGARSPFTQVSLMGGRPISALDLSGMFGHYTPTTGNARGATYIPPTATAQAPEHPAITAMRHLARAHAAMRQAVPRSHIPIGGGPGNVLEAPTGKPAPFESGFPEPYPGAPESGFPEPYPGAPESGFPEPSVNKPPPVAQNSSLWGDVSKNLNDLPGFFRSQFGYQGGGGVMGSSPVQNSAFSTSRDPGFGDLFGGGERPGFAEGGDLTLDQLIAASVPQGGARGPGPPAPPQAPQQPAPSGGDQPSKDTKDGLSKLGSAVKGLFNPSSSSSATPSTVGPSPGNVGSWNTGAIAGPDISDIPVAGVNAPFDLADTGFAIGGGVGLGSLRRPFQDGGEAAPTAIDQFLKTDAQPVAAPAGGGGGSAPANVQDLINQNFGERAGYATHISTAESGMGKSYEGDDHSSFGPFQLHYGGVSQKYPHPGLGDQFTQETGLDARDPKTVPDQVAWVSKYTAKHGWNDWSTAHEGGANAPSTWAQPASATTSYGGGFMLPGTGSNVGQLDRNNLQAPTMGDELRHDPFGYMMTVGAAMASSRSPWLGVGIGEGLAAGNKFLEGARQLEKEWGVAQANINNLGAEARAHDADSAYRVQQIQLQAIMTKALIQRMRQKGLLDGGGGTATPGGTGGAGTGIGAIQPIAPIGGGQGASGAPEASGGQGAAAPSGGAPGAGAAPPSLADEPLYKQAQDLYAQAKDAEYDDRLFGTHTAEDLRAQAGQLAEAGRAQWAARIAPYQKGQETAATQAATPHEVSDAKTGEKLPATYADIQKIQEDISAGRPPTIHGREVRLEMTPAAAAAKAGQVKGAEKTAEEAATPHVVYDAQGNSRVVSGTEYQRTGQEGLTPVMSPAAEARKAGQTELAKAGATQLGEEDEEAADGLHNMNMQEQRLNTLKTIMQRWQPGAWKEHLADIANLLQTAGFNVKDPSDAYEFLKNTTGEVFDALKQQKGAVRNMEIIGMQKANPSTEIPAQANAAMISQMLGIIHERQEYYKAYNDWRNTAGQNATTPRPFVVDWSSKHPIQKYIDNETANFPYLGQPIPKIKKDGALYMMPDGSIGRYSADKKGFDIVPR